MLKNIFSAIAAINISKCVNNGNILYIEKVL